MLKNPFLNTGHYKIVQEFGKLQRVTRSASSPQPTISSGFHFSEKFDDRYQGRITESRLFAPYRANY